MLEKPLDRLTQADIDQLVLASIPEGRTIDYKEDFPSTEKGGGKGAAPGKPALDALDQAEFLADVSSFANTSGGLLCYGIEEKLDGDGKRTGLPDKAVGVPLGSGGLDANLTRLQQIVRDGLDPRLAGVEVGAVEGYPRGPVVLLRVPRSWANPHAVKKNFRFYRRDGRGKAPMDVQEIRSAFLLAEGARVQVRRLREERIAALEGGESPLPLVGRSYMLLHAAPLSAFDAVASIDVARLNYATPIRPLRSDFGGLSTGHNFDGFFVHPGMDDRGTIGSYALVMRSGVIESVDAWTFSLSKKGIPCRSVENEVVEAVQGAMKLLPQLGLGHPIIVMLTFVGVRDFRLVTNPGEDSGRLRPIDRDILRFPEVVIEDEGINVPDVLRPLFDAVAQACGRARSRNYSAEGKWKGPF